MNKYNKKCFELEEMLASEREKRLESEKKYAEELKKMQERCHEAEDKCMSNEEEKINACNDYNELYKENIKLRYRLEEKKSYHGKKLKDLSLFGREMNIE